MSRDFLTSPFFTLDFDGTPVEVPDNRPDLISHPEAKHVTQSTTTSPTHVTYISENLNSSAVCEESLEESSSEVAEVAHSDTVSQKCSPDNCTDLRNRIKNDLKNLTFLTAIVNDRKTLSVTAEKLHQVHLYLSKGQLSMKGATKYPFKIIAGGKRRSLSQRKGKTPHRGAHLPEIRTHRKRQTARKAFGDG